MNEPHDQAASGVRVRFAPSPTGYLHVGGARTALFNWLFARQQRGTMILRVEDTDAERNKPELVQGIVDGLTWLGVDWDEGPFFQSQRIDLYREAAKKCLANGSAFLCYCAAEKYAGGDHAGDAGANETKVRRVARCSCRDGKATVPGAKPAVRFRVPAGKTVFADEVFGEREFDNEEIEDFVLLRSGKDGEEWALEMERNIDRNGSSKPRATRNVRTFGDLIGLHDEDMHEVGKPPRRSKAAVMASLKTELGSVKLPALNRERLIEFGRERAKQGQWSRNVGHRLVFHPDNHNACRCGPRHRSFGRGGSPGSGRPKSPQSGGTRQRA